MIFHSHQIKAHFSQIMWARILTLIPQFKLSFMAICIINARLIRHLRYLIDPLRRWRAVGALDMEPGSVCSHISLAGIHLIELLAFEYTKSLP